MNVKEYKAHFRRLAEEVKNLKCPSETVAIGFKEPIELYEVVGYLHNTRLHKTELKLSDFNFVRYMFASGSGVHYAEAEMSLLEGRVNAQIIRKVLIIRLK